MKKYGAFEAKTHFSELLNDVINGEKLIITNHGTRVAMMIPYLEEKQVNPVKNAIRALKMLRKEITLGKELSIRKMREEGRQ